MNVVLSALPWLVGAAIWVIMLIPGNLDLPTPPGRSDLAIHATLFAMWVGLWHVTWPKQSLSVWLTIMIISVTAIGTELAQAWWVPGRFGDWLDGIADLTGAITAGALSWWWSRRRDDQPTAAKSPAADDIHSDDGERASMC